MEVQTNGDTISSNIQTSTQDTVTSINSDNTNINHNYFNTETSGAYYKRYVTDNDWLSQLEPKKKTQVLIIIGAVAIIIFYMIVTVVIPSVYNTIHNFTEKRRLLQKLKQEIDNTEIEDISAIPIIPKEKEKKSFVKHRPNFALRAEEDANDNISRSLRDEDSVNGKSDIQYKKSSDRIINNTKRKSVRSTPAYQPSNSAYIAPENPFYSNYNFSSGASVSSALDESRALRLAQDAEYEESLRADREKKEKELKKKVRSIVLIF